jgi:2-amino-4-hydroxy-6-hydroxymethyldihydropteridine diphosphokinase
VILVALGANLPGPNGEPPSAMCAWAVSELGKLPGLAVTGVSHLYETAPDPPSGQPNYVNGAARLEGSAKPEALLAMLHEIEARAGRVRTTQNAARPLDLDLIAMDGLVRDAAPILPHPRAHLRAFVLSPLRDVAPEWRHPLTKLTPAEMLAALPGGPPAGAGDAENARQHALGRA